MRSYAVSLGTEPDFTNYAQTKSLAEPFIETLDYIFLSAHWKACPQHRQHCRSSAPVATNPIDPELIRISTCTCCPPC